MEVIHPFGDLTEPVEKQRIGEAQLSEFEHFVDGPVWHEFRYKKPLTLERALATVSHHVPVTKDGEDSRLLVVHSGIEKLLYLWAHDATIVHWPEGVGDARRTATV